MKYSILLIFSFLMYNIHAQNNGFLKKNGALLMVQEVKTFEGETTHEMYNNTLKWIEESDVVKIEIKSQEKNEKIEGNAAILATNFLGNNYSELTFELKIEYKTGRLRISCSKILIADMDGKTLSLDSYLYTNTGEEINNRKARAYRSEANRAFSQFFKDFSKFIELGEEEEFSDW